MLLFALWAVLVSATLAGAGYSHYRYRVINNQKYERLFAREREKLSAEISRNVNRSYAIPILTLVMVCLLVPMSLFI